MRGKTETRGKPESRPVIIPAGSAETGTIDLAGDLTIPADATGIVLFAHGSGSSRFSSRNRYVAEVLGRSIIATLLMDLLTQEEEAEERYTAHLRFDIPLLAGRLEAAADWLTHQVEAQGLALGLFGASTGAAAALIAAADAPDRVKAVVSRGGRPDLAGPALPRVRCPTLLIVGGDDTQVIALNQEALAELRCPKELRIIPGATHLFEEPGTLEAVARQAAEWFGKYLRP